MSLWKIRRTTRINSFSRIPSLTRRRATCIGLLLATRHRVPVQIKYLLPDCKPFPKMSSFQAKKLCKYAICSVWHYNPAVETCQTRCKAPPFCLALFSHKNYNSPPRVFILSNITPQKPQPLQIDARVPTHILHLPQSFPSIPWRITLLKHTLRLRRCPAVMEILSFCMRATDGTQGLRAEVVASVLMRGDVVWAWRVALGRVIGV